MKDRMMKKVSNNLSTEIITKQLQNILTICREVSLYILFCFLSPEKSPFPGVTFHFSFPHQTGCRQSEIPLESCIGSFVGKFEMTDFSNWIIS